MTSEVSWGQVSRDGFAVVHGAAIRERTRRGRSVESALKGSPTGRSIPSEPLWLTCQSPAQMKRFECHEAAR